MCLAHFHLVFILAKYLPSLLHTLYSQTYCMAQKAIHLPKLGPF